MNSAKILSLLAILLATLLSWWAHESSTTPTTTPNNQPASETHDPNTVNPVNPVNPQWINAVKYAQEKLPLEGQLVLNPDGFVYLKVDDNYIRTLFPMLNLKEEGYKEPPFFRRKDSPGAHISIFYHHEHISPTQVGQTFHFEPTKITIVRSKNKHFVVLQVNSPELEKLRESYGLSPKLFGHDFHISIGEKEIRHRGEKEIPHR